jgi:sugar lactone lactonase YvrE
MAPRRAISRIGWGSMDYKTEVLLDGLGFPDCPRWHDGRLFFSDQHYNHVISVDMNGDPGSVAEVPDTPAGIGWLPDGRLLVVSMKDRRVLRLDHDGIAVHADLSGLATFTLNDMVVDRQGNAYVGNFGYDISDPQVDPKFAEIVMVTPEGAAGALAHGLAFPSGMAITSDDSTLIVAESSAARLTAFTITLEGYLVERRIWAEFDKLGLVVDQDRVIPDGICVDAEGAVWMASPGKPGGVFRMREGGEITDRVEVEHQAFAAMLGGPEGKTLFVCTSAYDENSGLSGRIEMVEVSVPHSGLP